MQKTIISLSIILIGSIVANTSHAWTQAGKFRDWGVAVNDKNCAAWTVSKKSNTQAEIFVLFDKGQNTADVHFKIPNLLSKYQLKKVKLEVLGAKYDYQLNITEPSIASSTPANKKSIISAFRKGSDVKSNWSINDGKNRSSSFSLMGFTAAFLKASEKCGAEKFALTTAPGNQVNTKQVISNNSKPKNISKINLLDIKMDTRDHQDIINLFLAEARQHNSSNSTKSFIEPLCGEFNYRLGKNWAGCTDAVSFKWDNNGLDRFIQNPFHLILGANLALFDVGRSGFIKYSKSKIRWEFVNKKLTVKFENGTTLVMDISRNSDDVMSLNSKILEIEFQEGRRDNFNKRLNEINNKRQKIYNKKQKEYKAYLIEAEKKLIEAEKKEKLNSIKQVFFKFNKANQVNILNKLTETTIFEFSKDAEWDDDIVNAVIQYSREFIFNDDDINLPPKIEDIKNLFELILDPENQLSKYNKNIFVKLEREKKAEQEKLEREKKAEQEKLARKKKAEQEKLAREKKAKDEFSEKLKAHELKLTDKNRIGFRDFYIGMDTDIFTYLKNGAVVFRSIRFKNEDGKKCKRSNSKPLGDTCYGLDYKFSFSTGMKLNKIRVYVLNYVQSSSYIGNLFNMGTSEDPVVNLINSLNKKYKKSYSYSENERLLFNDGETDELYIAYEDGQVILSLERVDDGSYDTDIYAYITYRNKSDGLKFLDAIKPKTATSDF